METEKALHRGKEASGRETGRENDGAPKRMTELELLRCAAMMMVAALHYLGKGGLLLDLAQPVGAAGMAAWLVEAFCIVAVNVYMFISGYFLCMSSFKLSRLIQLWLQVWAYSVTFGLIGALTGILGEASFDTHYLLTMLFPISMEHYWFMTAYVIMYLLLPFVGIGVRKMTEQQMRAALGLLFFLFCFLKSVLPVRLEMDQLGYDCLWYLCVFLAAAYVRRFGVPFLEKRGRCLGLYVGSCLLIFGGTMILREIFLNTGSLERRMRMCYEYNHILPFLAAVGLFGAFRGMRIQGRAAKAIQRIAPHTLGVYLLHENLGLRESWQNLFGADRIAAKLMDAGSGAGAVQAAVSLFLGIITAAVCVFACGILADMVRKWMFGFLNRGLSRISLYRRLTEGVRRVDEMFAVSREEKSGGA